MTRPQFDFAVSLCQQLEENFDQVFVPVEKEEEKSTIRVLQLGWALVIENLGRCVNHQQAPNAEKENPETVRRFLAEVKAYLEIIRPIFVSDTEPQSSHHSHCGLRRVTK